MTLGDISRMVKGGSQPPRAPDDREYVGLRVEGDKLLIMLGDSSGPPTQTMLISVRNAWTLIGLLSIFVGLKLPKRIQQKIMLR